MKTLKVGVYAVAEARPRYEGILSNYYLDWKGPDVMGVAGALAAWRAAGMDVAVIDDASMEDVAEGEQDILAYASRAVGGSVRVIFSAAPDRSTEDPFFFQLISIADIKDVIMPALGQELSTILPDLIEHPATLAEVSYWKTDDRKLLTRPEESRGLKGMLTRRRIAKERSKIDAEARKRMRGGTGEVADKHPEQEGFLRKGILGRSLPSPKPQPEKDDTGPIDLPEEAVSVRTQLSCPECGKEVIEGAPRCPWCSHPLTDAAREEDARQKSEARKANEDAEALSLVLDRLREEQKEIMQRELEGLRREFASEREEPAKPACDEVREEATDGQEAYQPVDMGIAGEDEEESNGKEIGEMEYPNLESADRIIMDGTSVEPPRDQAEETREFAETHHISAAALFAQAPHEKRFSKPAKKPSIELTSPTAKKIVAVGSLLPGSGCTHLACAFAFELRRKQLEVSVAIWDKHTFAGMSKALAPNAPEGIKCFTFAEVDFFLWDEQRKASENYDVVVCDCGQIGWPDSDPSSPEQLFMRSNIRAATLSGAPWMVQEGLERVSRLSADTVEHIDWYVFSSDYSLSMGLADAIKGSTGAPDVYTHSIPYRPALFRGDRSWWKAYEYTLGPVVEDFRARKAADASAVGEKEATL